MEGGIFGHRCKGPLNLAAAAKGGGSAPPALVILKGSYGDPLEAVTTLPSHCKKMQAALRAL